MNFSAKLREDEDLPIHFVTFKTMDNKDCWHFIKCSRLKLKMLRNHSKATFDLKNFGHIIASGFGTAPDSAIINLLKTKHNYDYKPA